VHVQVSALVAEPGPLVAMKLQAIMNRAVAKQGTDLQDIVRLILDQEARPAALARSLGALESLSLGSNAAGGRLNLIPMAHVCGTPPSAASFKE
jgi:hypothetical protein